LIFFLKEGNSTMDILNSRESEVDVEVGEMIAEV